MEIQGHLLEEFCFKASSKGFFTEWQQEMSIIRKEKFLPIHEAGELAYKQLENRLCKY